MQVKDDSNQTENKIKTLYGIFSKCEWNQNFNV